MSEAFRLPDIGEGLTEAEVVQWLVAPGASVAMHQPVVEVLTDKSSVELPSPYSGTLEGHPHAPGDIVAVGAVLFRIDTGPAPVSDAPALDPSPSATPSARPKAAPSTRRLARERGIDLHTITGSGPGGRILATDLDEPASVAATPSAPPPMSTTPSRTVPLRGIRRTIATTMTQAWTEIPHIHLFDDVDASALLELRRRLREDAPDRTEHLTMLSFLVAATANALAAHPQMNASIDLDADVVVTHDDINIGIAVATENGVVVPVVRAADRRSVIEVANEIAAHTTAARNGTIGHDDLTGGTFTITNYGAMGGRHATPIIRPPECGILGFGRTTDRPIALDGHVVVRPLLPVVLGADHRLVDGDIAVAFIERVLASIRNPLGLLAGL